MRDRKVQPFDEDFLVNFETTTVNKLLQLIYQRHDIEAEHDSISIVKINSNISNGKNKGKNKNKNKNEKKEKEERQLIEIPKVEGLGLKEFGIQQNTKLLYQCGLPWKMERLLWIAHLQPSYKNENSNKNSNKNEYCNIENEVKTMDGNEGKDDDDEEEKKTNGNKLNVSQCCLSKVPKDIILHIISFFTFVKSKVDNRIWIQKDFGKWRECIILYEAFRSYKIHYLNYSSYYDEWISNNSDNVKISLIDPQKIKHFDDI